MPKYCMISDRYVRKVRSTSIVFILLCATACETMPPEAEQHASALLAYHNKTTAGTVSCFDKAVAGGEFAVETLGGQVEQLWMAYVSDIDEATRSLNALRDVAAGLRARLAEKQDQALSPFLETLDPALKTADAQAATLKKYRDDALTSMRADLNAIREYKTKTATAASDLRLLIQEHTAKVAEGIELHRQLCASYTLVSTSRNAFFGGKFDTARKEADAGASLAFDRLSKALDPYLEASKVLSH